jgi:primosomal protein N' (replication factor Y)
VKYLEIGFQQKSGPLGAQLTYSCPPELEKSVKIGQLVKLKLRHREKTGLILEIHENKPDFKTSDILEIIDEKPLLSSLQMRTLKWMQTYYLAPVHLLLKLFIPKRIFDNKPMRESKSAEKKLALDIKTLNKEQKNIFEQINSAKSEVSNKFLIQGITGSGKTEIYVHLAKEQLEKEKQVLILVPEISLTPQTIAYFQCALGQEAAAINSKLSEGQRYKAWKNIQENKAKLIIGSRSALFAPFQDLSLIIIDEEHENCYKQDSSPRYHVHEVIETMLKIARSEKKELKAVFGSATPSIETRYKLRESTLKLTKRINKNPLPTVKIVDLREEFHKKNYSMFSEDLEKAIRENLAEKKQIILFLNRRGSASSVVCRDCGYTHVCKLCETKMTYHAKNHGGSILICHHCGHIESSPTECPKCESKLIRYLGIGTEKVEQEAKELFKGAKVLRADRDTTSTKHGFEKIYKAFKNHEADILVGTQMIAKGLHLPKVDLVGVMLADIGLNIPNFKTNERNYQLLTQVAGRAGRGKDQKKPGQVIIQTYSPKHRALKATEKQDFENFYETELLEREKFFYPPFGKLVKILVEASSSGSAQETAQRIEEKLYFFAREAKIAKELDIFYYPSYVMRLKDKYRYTVLIHSRSPELNLHPILEKLADTKLIDLSTKVDIDPISV